MLRIASQTAGPIGLTFFVDTHAYPGGFIGKKNRKYFFFNIFFHFIFHGQRWALQLVITII